MYSILTINDFDSRFHETKLRKIIIETLLETKYFDNDINFLFESAIKYNSIDELWSNSLNEDKFKDWLVNKGKKAKESISDLSDAAKKKTAELVASTLQSFDKFINTIVENIKSFLQKSWKQIEKNITESYDKNKNEIVSKVGEFLKKHENDRTNIIKEQKNLTAVCKFAVSYASGGVVSKMKDAFNKAGGEEVSEQLKFAVGSSVCECIREDSTLIDYIMNNEINESTNLVKIPGLSTLSQKIAHYPPFSLLHEVEHKVSSVTNNTFSKASRWTGIVGGPGPFEFVFVGTIIGLISGYVIKHSAEEGVKSMAEKIAATTFEASVAVLLPGIGFLLSALKWAAKGIWLVGIMEASISAVYGVSDSH